MCRVLIHGKHAAIAAIKNPQRKIEKVFILKDKKEDYKDILKKNLKTTNIEYCSAKQMSKICRYDSPNQGICLIAHTLPQSKLEDLLANTKDSKSLVVILDKVTDPFNIGNILRSCAAFGVKCLVVQDKSFPKETSVIAKSASGALESVPICKEVNISSALNALQQDGYFCYGLDCDSTSGIANVDFPKKTAFVLGAEGCGIRSNIKKKCDEILQIPMIKNSLLDSINVSNAAAIAMYSYHHKISKFTII